MNNITRRLLMIAFVATGAFAQLPFMPADRKALKKTISYGEMESLLRSVDGQGPVHVTVEGKTAQGRSVYLVRMAWDAEPAWKVLLYAQQDGDEVSGKDALLYLIRDIAEHPDHLPKDTAVWVLPMMNPDGAEAGTRANATGADLNRDHITLEQPETQSLHMVARRVRPDVAVDCREFARAPEAWRKRGWEKWPDITMDRLNNPLFDSALMAAADRWVETVGEAETKGGHPVLRHSEGGLPPNDEQRHSSPDIDSAMNAIGTYGGLSFIIEAAARDGQEAIARELGSRVDAYLVAFRRLLAPDPQRSKDRVAIESARTRALPPFLPVNYLWVNTSGKVTQFPVADLASGKKVEVPTANMMTDIAIKKSVTTPRAYAVEPRAAAAVGELLRRQGIAFEKLDVPRAVESAESCMLQRVEEQFDDVYSRSVGRQIVRCSPADIREIGTGWLWVSLRGDSAVRAALILEPQALYGLYQYPHWRVLAAEGGALPVVRVMR